MSKHTSLHCEAHVWHSWLGIVAVLLGVLLAATYATEWMKPLVLEHATSSNDNLPMADCPEDELEEEGLSVAECEQMVLHVTSYLISAPDWFPRLHAALAAMQTGVAIGSIVVGIALIGHRSWAPVTAILTFGGLALLDIAWFTAVVNTGPM